MRLQPRKPVNEKSVRSLKQKALRRTKTYRYDPETGERVEPGRIQKWMATIKKPFTKLFWQDLLESNDNEILVDGKLLCYSYLEAGIIETIGG
jgi:sodium/potassium-transporting ATPase subunit alpha